MLQTQSMSEVMVLSATHSRRQLETIAQQSREIASAAQKLATETTRPLGFGIHQPDGDGHRPCAHPVVCFVALFCPSVNADEHGVDDRRDGPVSANSLSRLCGYPLQRRNRGPIEYSAVSRKLRTVARTIPALLQRIPMDNAAQMSASGGALIENSAFISKSSDFL